MAGLVMLLHCWGILCLPGTGTQAHCSLSAWLCHPLFVIARWCSWGWRWVVCHGAGACGVVSCHLGVLVSMLVLALLLDCHGEAHASSSSVPTIIHSPYPTCKQVLAVVGTGGGLVFSVSGGLSTSLTWHAYGVHWVLTKWVSPSWGLPASLCALLACVDSLTSHLNGEGGWGVVGMHCMFFVVAGCR